MASNRGVAGREVAAGRFEVCIQRHDTGHVDHFKGPRHRTLGARDPHRPPLCSMNQFELPLKGARKLVIDVTGLKYIDSSGIGMLVSSNGFMEQSGGRMRIAGAQGAVAKAFEVVHVSRIVPLDADLESACRNLAAGSAAV